MLELVGVERPAERNGVVLAPVAGSSFVPVLTDAAVPSTHREHVVEMNGHRGYYRDGWHAVTLHQAMTPFVDERWELYHLDEDPTELHDLAAVAARDDSRELQEAWEAAAWEQQIYPLDEGTAIKYVQRPERNEVFGEPVTIVRGTSTLERWRSVQLIWFRSVTITARLEHRAGDQGMLVAHGDQGAGYALYVLNGELFFVHNNGRGQMLEVSGGDDARRRSRSGRNPQRARAARAGISSSRSTAKCARRSRACRCSSGSHRSRASTWASTGARRSRGTSTSASGRSRTPARCTR